MFWGGAIVLSGTQSEFQNGPYEFELVDCCTLCGCTIQNSPCEFQKIFEAPKRQSQFMNLVIEKESLFIATSLIG